MTDIEILREYIGDTDPQHQQYTDEQLQAWLDFYNGDIRRTAHHIWLMKATAVQTKISKLKLQRVSIGSETYEYRNLIDEYDLCMKMAEMYAPGGDPYQQTVRIINKQKQDIFSNYKTDGLGGV